MASKRGKFGNFVTLATADDVDGTIDNSQILDLKGAFGAMIVQLNLGTAGTLGVDAIEFSRDGGITYKAATAANIGNGHGGLRKLSDNTAVASAQLNAAGVEPVSAATSVFFLGAVDGPFQIRCGRLTTTTTGTTWATGAPLVIAARMG